MRPTRISALFISGWVALGSAAVPQAPCDGKKPALVVDTAAHVVHLCLEGQEVGHHSIRLGRNGTGKTREGDGKTPLGTYALGIPRKSSQFGTFIPIGYPTPEQQRAKFTGGSIGIHGPHRWIKWAGRINNLFDTTDGCIGVASDEEMLELSTWILRHKPKVIHIR